MKNRVKNDLKRVTGLVLSLIIALSCFFALGVTAAADSRTRVTDVHINMKNECIPEAGKPIRKPVSNFYVSSGRMYYIDYQSCWYLDHVVKKHDYDDDGKYIWYDYYPVSDRRIDSTPGNPVFEAGCKYHLEMTIYIDRDKTDRFYFANNIKDYNSINLKIDNLPDSMYKVDLIRGVGKSTGLEAYITFTVPGEQTFDDIEKVTIYDEYKEYSGIGRLPIKPGSMYGVILKPGFGNYTGEREWIRINGGKEEFVAGESYIYRAKFYAMKGYCFSPDVKPELWGYGDRYKPSKTELSRDRKTFTVEYIFTVEDFDMVDEITLSNTLTEDKFVPGYNLENNHPSTTTYLSVPQDALYKMTNYYSDNNAAAWHDEKGDYPAKFNAGYVYHTTYNFAVKDNRTTRFARKAHLSIANVPESDYIEEVDEEYNYLYGDIVYKTTLYFIAGSLDKEFGQSAEYPVWCNSYEGLKWAMSRPEIKYVRFEGSGGTIYLPRVETDGKPQSIDGITVVGTKYLNINGISTTFSAPDVDKLAYCEYRSLISVPADSELIIDAKKNTGITFNGRKTDNKDNCVIYNSGNLTVNGGVFTADTEIAGVNAFAIANAMGFMYINGGTFTAYNSIGGNSGAVQTVGGKTVINGGTFSAEPRTALGGGGDNYGLYIYGGTDMTDVTINGGTYGNMGIKLGDGVSRLSTYCKNSAHRVYLGDVMVTDPSELTQDKMDNNLYRPVRIMSYINDVEVICSPPIVNDKLDIYPNVLTDNLIVRSVTWYKNGTEIPYPTEHDIEPGASYSVEIILKGDLDNWACLDTYDAVRAKLNGKSVTVKNGDLLRNSIKIQYDFGTAAYTLFDLRAYFTVPEEHKKPQTSRLVAGEDDKYAFDYPTWYKNGEVMDTNEEFAVGNEYSLETRVLAKNPFTIRFNDEKEAYLIAVLNDNFYAASYKQDPKNAKYAVIRWNFGELDDRVIEEINLSFAQPGAGELPVYTAASLDERFFVGPEDGSAAYDSWYDANNQEHTRAYTRNHMTYYDITDGEKLVYEDTPLIAGHKYRVWMYVNVQPIYLAYNSEIFYKFYSSNYGGNATNTTATVNGNPAVSEQVPFSSVDTIHRVYYDFVCDKPMISAIEIKDVAEPIADQNANAAATSANPALYTVRQSQWKDGGGTYLTPSNAFDLGRWYYLEVTIDAKDCHFTPGMTVLVNGETAEEVTVEGDTVVAVKKFTAMNKPSYIPGDLNGDGTVTDQDAVYLLFNTFFAGDYPVNQPVDFNKDGSVTDADAIYLLFYTFFPNDYPLQ